MVIDYYRTRKLGPESEIEDIVADQIHDFLNTETGCHWTAGSPQIGSGMPDLIAASCDPQVYVLAQTDISTSQILAYLRAVGCVRKQTIINRTAIPEKTLVRCLDDLVNMDVVSNIGDKFKLSPRWRAILPEIVTIEVKVKNWKEAVAQASRNRIYSHRSYVAFPEPLARRVRSESVLKQLGIGLIAVSTNNTVLVLRRPRKHQPLVWQYYYDIAVLIAKNGKGVNDAIHCADRTGES